MSPSVASALRAFALGAVFLLTPAAATGADGEPLTITGAALLDETRLREAAGAVPRGERRRRRWVQRAIRRVSALYAAEGYTEARVWGSADGDAGARLHVDEGRMDHIAFVGPNMLKNFLYRVDLHLPRNVFHAPTCDRYVAEIESKYGLDNVYYRVTESERRRMTPLGFAVPERNLTIYVIGQERFGWSLGLRLDPRFGFVPTVGGRTRSLLFEEDRLLARVGVGLPYRAFFESEPRFQWVYGGVEVDYQLPAVAGILAPNFAGEAVLARHARVGVLPKTFLISGNEAFANLRLLLGRATVTLGGGVDHRVVFRTLSFEDATRPPPSDQDVLRYAARLVTHVDFTPNVLRQDLRDTLQLRMTWGDSPDPGVGWILDAQLTSQHVVHFGEHLDHDFIVRARGLFKTGDVTLLDEEPLAGSYLRVFFSSRYFVREAGQIDMQMRFSPTGGDFKLGLFYDASVFVDRQSGDKEAMVAQAAGPSLNFVLFDFIGVDVYYGFGLAGADDFGHNFFLQAATAY